ncbi:hypothetical protein TGAM01_v201260 [Trichoderma gamsii]|uniref:MORN repeat protein n=1 Tax=Trichoderma gamsii TaxID=398673 RepID=A0A2P5A015_9HYPO|nr:hypothetical protein TGAM01_v201260 [Trichoderma gamsii]PON29894.1 hypothetical protein TGAM01_v201260 [Trichoderma gamsii]
MAQQLETIDETITINGKTGQYTGSAYPITSPGWNIIFGYDPHGRGILRYSDGSVYDGQWEHSNYSGSGKYTSKDEEYVGSWVDGLKSGHGKLITSDGQIIYDGWFANDKRSGAGTLNYVQTGVSYTGQWSKDVPSGKGTWKWADGSWWESTWGGSNGKTASGSGRTRRLFANGDLYEGETTNHEMTGTGKVTLSSGEVYRGQVKNSKRHGQGSFKTLDEMLYEGKWVYNNKSGRFRITDLAKGKVRHRNY